MNPEIHFNEDTSELVFRIFNCTFKELAPKNNAVCQMHHALIYGIFSYFFADIHITEKSTMLEKNQKACAYTTIILDKQ
nr:methanogen output domain 1-containing protein [Salipaludibacillus neizhouensis]